MISPRGFSLHAERLNRDVVWARTDRVLRYLERRGGRATVFVHPFEAIGTGVDIRPRIAELAERGHEIGQHTHFYYGEHSLIPGKKPEYIRERDNTLRCLDRDLEYLRSGGVTPVGFTAGGWAIDIDAERWIAERGFTYDCSYRTFDLAYVLDAALAGADARPEIVDGVLHLPTTASLNGAARRLPRGPDVSLGYGLFTAHDYDLLSTRYRVALHAVIAAWSRSGPWATGVELAQVVREAAS